MSTHKKVRDQLDKSIEAHRKAHRHHLEQVGLQEYADSTISPLGPAGDLGATPDETDG